MLAPGRGRAEAGRDPGAPPSPLPSDPLHLAPPACPAPFPTWIRGGLANSLLREAGRGEGLILPGSSRRRFYTPPPLQLGFSRRRAPHPTSGDERCFLSQGAGAGMAGPQAHTALGLDSSTAPTPP